LIQFRRVTDQQPASHVAVAYIPRYYVTRGNIVCIILTKMKFVRLQLHRRNQCRGGAPIGAGGHDPPLFEAKGDGGVA